MLTRSDFNKIVEYSKTRKRGLFIGPWGWESGDEPIDVQSLLDFIESTIGIKEHISASNSKLPRQ